MTEPLLDVRSIHVSYGPIKALTNVSLNVNKGEMVALLGGNASGKSTTIKSILGIVHISEGEIWFDGERISGLKTPQIIARGMASVPEGRRVFPRMTVRENLLLGAYLRKDEAAIADDLELVLTIFPALKERLRQRAGTMSGGEQQMLAVGRALMRRPKMICIDEPSMGLSPKLVGEVYRNLRLIKERGVTLFMVEQNAHMALGLADRAYILRHGEIVLSGNAKDLASDEGVRAAYLGGHGAATVV